MKFIESNLSVIKIIFFLLYSVVAVFVDIERPWIHWTWPVFIALIAALIGLEIFQHRRNKETPIEKFRRYLSDFGGWVKTELKDYYVADPRFTISSIEQEKLHLDYQQEWTRGEIGYHYEIGNTAYYVGAFMNELLLRKIHIVVFDGGKKITVAPNWEPIGRGRFYYYLADSIEYAYKEYLARERGEDHACGIRQSDVSGTFNIPVLKDEKELRKFIIYCDEPADDPTTEENNEQIAIFYNLLVKYHNFKQRNGRHEKSQSSCL